MSHKKNRHQNQIDEHSSFFEKKKTVKSIASDSLITSQTREVGGANQEKTDCQISWSYDIEINPILGGKTQKNNDILGVNMKEHLQRYYDYLCGEHTNKTTMT